MKTLTKKQIIVFGIIIIFIISLSVVISFAKNKQDLRSRATENSTIQVIPKEIPKTDLCEEAKITGRVLSQGKFLNIIAQAKSPGIKRFGYAFFNRDNILSNSDNLSLISFVPGKDLKITHTLKGDADISQDILTVRYADMDKPDLNWDGNKPKRIQVNVYFEDNQGNRSVTNKRCKVSFDVE